MLKLPHSQTIKSQKYIIDDVDSVENDPGTQERIQKYKKKIGFDFGSYGVQNFNDTQPMSYVDAVTNDETDWSSSKMYVLSFEKHGLLLMQYHQYIMGPESDADSGTSFSGKNVFIPVDQIKRLTFNYKNYKSKFKNGLEAINFHMSNKLEVITPWYKLYLGNFSNNFFDAEGVPFCEPINVLVRKFNLAHHLPLNI